jgi:hypothetical protein
MSLARLIDPDIEDTQDEEASKPNDDGEIANAVETSL